MQSQLTERRPTWFQGHLRLAQVFVDMVSPDVASNVHARGVSFAPESKELKAGYPGAAALDHGSPQLRSPTVRRGRRKQQVRWLCTVPGWMGDGELPANEEASGKARDEEVLGVEGRKAMRRYGKKEFLIGGGAVVRRAPSWIGVPPRLIGNRMRVLFGVRKDFRPKQKGVRGQLSRSWALHDDVHVHRAEARVGQGAPQARRPTLEAMKDWPHALVALNRGLLRFPEHEAAQVASSRYGEQAQRHSGSQFPVKLLLWSLALERGIQYFFGPIGACFHLRPVD